MSIRIYVDMDQCQNYGQCCFEAADIFQLDENGQLRFAAEVDDSRRSDIESAADVCPMQAISVE